MKGVLRRWAWNEGLVAEMGMKLRIPHDFFSYCVSIKTDIAILYMLTVPRNRFRFFYVLRVLVPTYGQLIGVKTKQVFVLYKFSM